MRVCAEHPVREELHNELHARPSLYFRGDTDVWHVAIVGENGVPSFPASAGSPVDVTSTQEGKHGIARFEGGRLKWEVHMEILTLTFVTQANASAEVPVPKAFRTLCDEIESRIIAFVRVLVREEKNGKAVERPSSEYAASTACEGNWSPSGGPSYHDRDGSHPVMRGRNPRDDPRFLNSFRESRINCAPSPVPTWPFPDPA